MKSVWPSIIRLWLVGVLAAAQLAKFASLAPLVQRQFYLGLPAAGLLVSLLEAGGAVFGFASGLALSRIGAPIFLRSGLITMALAGLAEALAARAPLLFAARALEGIGYLLVVVAAPAMIVSLSRDARTRIRAMALWSSFVPVGMGAGGAVTGLLAFRFGLCGTLLSWSLLCALAALSVLSLKSTAPVSRHLRLPAPGAWIMTGAFGCYTLFSCAMTALLPSFLVARYGLSLADADVMGAIVAVACLPSAGIALMLVRGREATGRLLLAISAMALVLTAGIGPLIYSGSASWRTGMLAAALSLISGIAGTLLFTRLPALSGARTATDTRIAATTGLLTQCGAGGALLGPPLGALAVSRWGWTGLGWLISLLALAMLALVLLAEGCSAAPGRRNDLPPDDPVSPASRSASSGCPGRQMVSTLLPVEGGGVTSIIASQFRGLWLRYEHPPRRGYDPAGLELGKAPSCCGRYYSLLFQAFAQRR